MTIANANHQAGSQVTAVPAAPPAEAHAHFRAKLAYEADPADVAKAIADGSADFVLVDTRPAGNYRKAHLPGAVSLPLSEITAETVAALPAGLLVTYCWGPACNAATKGAERLAALGRPVTRDRHRRSAGYGIERGAARPASEATRRR